MKNVCTNDSIGIFILIWIFKYKLKPSLKEMPEIGKELFFLPLLFSREIVYVNCPNKGAESGKFEMALINRWMLMG